MRSQACSEPKTCDESRGYPFLYPLLLGFNAQVIQLVLFREAMVLSNGSEISLGVCFAVWALFNGAGALIGWLLIRLHVNVGRFFLPVLGLLPLLLCLSIHGARVARFLVDVPGSEPIPLAVFSFLAMMVLAPVTFLDGFLFLSVLEKLFGTQAGGRNTSAVYGVASFGALAGGLLFSLALAGVLTPFAIAGLLLSVNAVFLLSREGNGWKGYWAKHRMEAAWRCLLCMGGVATLIAGSSINAGSERERWRVLQPSLAWEASIETPYQNLAVLRYENEYSLFGNSHFLYTLRSKPSSESHDWEQALFPNFAMLQPATPERVLLLGGGPRGYLTDLLEYEPKDLKWVEYDRAVLELCEKYMIMEDREAWERDPVLGFATDGRLFVKSLKPRSLDLILVDVPDPANANLNRYYTQEFFEECRRALDENGTLVLGLSSQPNYIGEEMLQRNGSVFTALKSVFPHVLITPGTYSFLAAGGAETDLTADPGELIRRYRSRGLTSDRFSPYLFHTSFEPDALNWIGELFNASFHEGRFSTNTDDQPVAYYADSRLSAVLTSDPGERFMEGWNAFRSGGGDRSPGLFLLFLGVLLPGLAVLLCFGSLLRPGTLSGRRADRAIFILAALAVGFCGIVLEVAVLFAFQNHVGYLYSRMGVLIACYMAGLSAGSFGKPVNLSLRGCFGFSILFVVLGWAETLYLISGADRLPSGPWAWLAFFGFANVLFGISGGLAFRGITRALKDMGTRGGGLIYALDILGTFAGGWLAGSRLIPCFGIGSTLSIACALFFVFCLSACVVVKRTRGGEL
ncbi:MAG: hypothetical protein ABIK28_10340 [Planctomycetota bacterium]